MYSDGILLKRLRSSDCVVSKECLREVGGLSEVAVLARDQIFGFSTVGVLLSVFCLSGISVFESFVVWLSPSFDKISLHCSDFFVDVPTSRSPSDFSFLSL